MAQALGRYWSRKPALRGERVHGFAQRALRLLGRVRGKRLLDLGCGLGQDALFFARKGMEVTALDIAPENIRRLSERARKAGWNVEAIARDLIRRLPFPDRSLDVAYAHLSLHYFDDATTRRIIHNVRSVLRPGGWFFIKCKSIDDSLYGKGKKIGHDMYHLQHDRHFFSATYMRDLLSDWRVIRIRRTHSTYAGKPSAFIEAIARS